MSKSSTFDVTSTETSPISHVTASVHTKYCKVKGSKYDVMNVYAQ